MTTPGTFTWHPEYYFNNGTYIIWVKDELYKLFHPILVFESPIFAHLFSLPPEWETVEGKIDAFPILIDPDLTADVFDLFVELKFVW